MIKNILLLGAVNPGAIENYYTSGFEKCEVRVDRFDIYERYVQTLSRSVFNKVLNKISPAIFYRPINEDLLAFIKGKFYDAIVVFKGMEIFPETLPLLRKHTNVLANFNGDHPYDFYFPGSGNKNVSEGIKHYDIYFSYARSIVERLQQESNKAAYQIPFGFDASIYQPNANSAPAFQSDFLFIGAYDPQRANYLNKLDSSQVKIYGDEKWSSRNQKYPTILKAYQNKSLFGKEYQLALKNASGIINLLREQNLVEKSHNMRTFEVPGSGGVLLSQRTDEQQEFFEDGKEAIFFDSMEELKSKIKFLAASPATIQQIKSAAYIRSIKSGYSYDDRSRQMLQYLEAAL
jgi:spore maturation protein CgeB